MITNIVATAKLNTDFDLERVSVEDDMSSYNPTKFSALLMRRLSPFKSHCQLYRNGKITVNGARTTRQARALCRMYCRILRRLGFASATVTDFKIVNIVASHVFDHPLNLRKLYKVLPRAVYEPELFPGLSCKLSNCTAVLFYSGKVNLLGLKHESHVSTGIAELTALINLAK
jgi:transcription initiation factor TFIID TATA-box-binding protein